MPRASATKSRSKPTKGEPHRWQPGRSGNPAGRKPGETNAIPKIMRDAMIAGAANWRGEVERPQPDGTVAKVIVEGLEGFWEWVMYHDPRESARRMASLIPKRIHRSGDIRIHQVPAEDVAASRQRIEAERSRLLGLQSPAVEVEVEPSK